MRAPQICGTSLPRHRPVRPTARPRQTRAPMPATWFTSSRRAPVTNFRGLPKFLLQPATADVPTPPTAVARRRSGHRRSPTGPGDSAVTSAEWATAPRKRRRTTRQKDGRRHPGPSAEHRHVWIERLRRRVRITDGNEPWAILHRHPLGPEIAPGGPCLLVDGEGWRRDVGVQWPIPGTDPAQDPEMALIQGLPDIHHAHCSRRLRLASLSTFQSVHVRPEISEHSWRTERGWFEVGILSACWLQKAV